MRNLTENAAIENIEAMINCLRLLDRLGVYLQQNDWDIYNYLGTFAEDTQDKLPKKGTVLGNQWAEELEKAEQIRKVPSMEDRIKAAEGYAFFDGTIRFLFTGRSGELDWSNFEKKFENAKMIDEEYSGGFTDYYFPDLVKVR